MLQVVDDPLDDVVIDLHAVRREVVVSRAIEIMAAHSFHRQPARTGHGLDDGLYREHSLRTAVAAEGGVRDRVGFAWNAAQPDVRQPVAIVGVAERSDQHGGRVVCNVAAICG